MSTYIWWAVNRGLQLGGGFFATHPVQTSLAMAALAHPGTRGFAWRVIKGFTWNSARYMWANLVTVGRAAAAESKIAKAIGDVGQGLKNLALRNPLTTIVLLDIAAATAAIQLAKHEDPKTESAQMLSTAHGLGGSGAGGGVTQPSIGGGGKWLIEGGSFF